MRIFRDHRRLTAGFFLYYFVLVVYGLTTDATRSLFYATFIAIAAVLIARIYSKNDLSSLVLWGLAAWGFAHMVGGLIELDGRVIYEHELLGGEFRFDKIVHFFGFGFSTLAAHELLRSNVGPAAAARPMAIAAFFIGIGVGAVNETVEFLITLLPAEHNVGGFSNTGWDLVANTLGCALAARVALSRENRSARGGNPRG